MKKAISAILMFSCIAFASAAAKDIVISTPGTALVLNAEEGMPLKFCYYGDFTTLSGMKQLRAAGDAIDKNAYPSFGTGNLALPALAVTHNDGNITTDLIVTGVSSTEEAGSVLTVISTKDKVYPLYVDMCYRAYKDTDVIEMWTVIRHTEKKPVVMDRFDSGCLYFRRGDVWVSHLDGEWAAETSIVTEPLKAGMLTVRSYDGARNGQMSHGEIMVSLDGKPRENEGRAVGAALCWSGDYELRVNTDDNRTHSLYAGICAEPVGYVLDPHMDFETPHLAVSYSNEGIGGVSRNFHRYARGTRMHNGSACRDILLNSWEGVYFNINQEGMDGMMSDIASMGGELFVMDDGWFGRKYPRNDDTSSLGDWVVDMRKLPDGIDGLLASARKYGIKFGIWLEPEAISPASELFEKHPDWALKATKRDYNYGRGGTQLLLDLTNPAVQDCIVNMVDTLLTSYPEIAYIKWDANGAVRNFGSPYLKADKQGNMFVDYHRGLESVMKRIRSKYPGIVIQACGGGGGRINYGVMPYFDEYWVSDNTDAYQRLFIQWGTSYFYPSNSLGQHVSAEKNHQTGRVIPLKFRFDVAMTGRLGMEIQPKDMSAEDKDFARKAIRDYKSIRPVVQLGNQYRLISPYEGKNVASMMYVTDDKSRAVFFAYKMEHYMFQQVPRFMAAGLDAGRNYRIRELTVPEGEKPSGLDGAVISGAILMNTGFEVPLDREYASRVYELTAE